jgi:hypothetical protein
MEPHPIRMVVRDDLRRSRLTVFFRLLLAIPHLIWLVVWTYATSNLIAPIAWLLTLIMGRLPEPLWRYFSSYVRYSTHVFAFIFLAANPFPGFLGRPGSYPIDLEVAAPGRQSRWKTLFRIVLVLPAFWLALVLFVYVVPVALGYDEATDQYYGIYTPAGAAAVVAFLGWFVCLALGRISTGFRDLLAYTLRYGAQTSGYFYLLTDRYPNADPSLPAASQPTPDKPVNIRVEGDLRRSRLTVFFRLLLTFPHFIWLLLWGIAVFFALIVGWFATLITGRLPNALHRFVGAYLRYEIHVFAFLYFIANPFPGFTGTPGSYPVDVEIAPREQQKRWKTLFRVVLAVPAHLLASALNLPLQLVALFGWFVGLVLGRMPEGLRNLGAFCLRYTAQTNAYVYLLTDSYPYSGPSEYVEPAPAIEPEAVPAWPGPLRPPSLSS